MPSKITLLGHSSVLVEIDDQHVLFDPVFSKRIGHLRRIGMSPKINLKKVNIIVISHLHWDHFDPKTIRQFDKDTKIVAPLSAHNKLIKLGFNNLVKPVLGKKISVNKLSLTPLMAIHNDRLLTRLLKNEFFGYLLDGKYSVYFAGDTDLFPEMSKISNKIDVALIPVWGWGPNLGRGHMDPMAAAKSLRLLKPKVAIPIHWGTYTATGYNLLNPDKTYLKAERFKKEASKIHPKTKVKILKINSSITLEKLFSRNPQVI